MGSHSGFCENNNNLNVAQDKACLSAMLLTTNQVYPAVLNAAIELNLFDILANKASPPGSFMSAAEIASHLPSRHLDTPDRLERMLRLLASYTLLTCSSRDIPDGSSITVYGLSPVGKYCVTNETGGYLASFTTFLCYKALLEIWMNFKEAVMDPDVDLFKKVHGKTSYEYFGTDPKLNHIFNKAMADVCATEMNRVLELYKGFEGISTLVDVGGGNGQNLRLIISRYPSIRGLNFDLPQVIQHAPLIPGIEHIGGDMFVNVPKGDAVILKAVCHNWSDEKCIEFLRKCHEALPENGKVIVVEFILPESPEPTEASKLVSTLDNLMFITVGGRERTEKQYETLGKRSGFPRFQVACRAFSALGVMEFYK
ncbi:isoliquiritigenin 2'-O-methyltransferase-like [Prosopis cineraria]|uniref:isoliquiritigenin 2'-O-methyltransferase-like n=1 Tax=Prosopis cineraria TaxID=364024 RepID=UPI00240F4443|nr:isoliquiritigenin 2'-O-methyltransferase-like [Prosopis cineraria]